MSLEYSALDEWSHAASSVGNFDHYCSDNRDIFVNGTMVFKVGKRIGNNDQ